MVEIIKIEQEGKGTRGLDSLRGEGGSPENSCGTWESHSQKQIRLAETFGQILHYCFMHTDIVANHGCLFCLIS